MFGFYFYKRNLFLEGQYQVRLINNSLINSSAYGFNKIPQQRENKSKIYFGYDPVSDNELLKEASFLRENEILQVHEICGQIEDQIKSYENERGGADKAFSLAMDKFIPLKIALIQLVTRNMPNSAYPQAQEKLYIKEIDQKVKTNAEKESIEWRKVLIESLKRLNVSETFCDGINPDFTPLFNAKDLYKLN